MAMVSMKCETKPEGLNVYSSGLCLYLNPEQVEALGITTPPEVGSKIKVSGIACVKEVVIRGDEGEKKLTMMLEIEAMEVGKTSKSAELYSDD